MNRSCMLKNVIHTFVWVIIFLGSVSAVTAIRRCLRDNEEFAITTRALTTEAIHLTSLLVP